MFGQKVKKKVSPRRQAAEYTDPLQGLVSHANAASAMLNHTFDNDKNV